MKLDESGFLRPGVVSEYTVEAPPMARGSEVDFMGAAGDLS